MRIANANICLDDDTLFIGEECPQCLGRSYYPLRKWLAPLHSFRDIKEAHNAKRNLPIQEGPADSLLNTYLINNTDVLSSKIADDLNKIFPTGVPRGVSRDNPETSSSAKISEGHNPSGVKMERKGSFESWCNWIDASITKHFPVVDGFLKRGFEMPSKKHYSGNDHPQTLPEDKPEFASGTDKV